MSDQNKVLSSEAIRKRAFREKLKTQLGEEEYKKQQAQKKREYRAKIKLSKAPQEQQKQVVQQVVQQVVEKVTPVVVKNVVHETKGKITNYFKPATKVEDKSQSKITSFFKPISKQQFLKNVKTEPIKDLIKEINTTLKKIN